MNPFSSRSIRPDHSVYRFHPEAKADQEQLYSFLSSTLQTLNDRRLASIVGPHGTGKSTLLRTLEPTLRECFGRVSWTMLSTERRSRWTEIWDGKREAETTPCLITNHSRHASASRPSANGDSEKNRARRLTPGGCCIVVDGFEQLPWFDRWLLIWHVQRAPSTSLLVTSHRPLWPIPVCHQTRCSDEMTRLLTAEKLAGVDEPIRNQLWSKLETRLASRKNQVTNVRDLWFAMYDEFETIRQQEQPKS